jgi:gamma-glutamylcyclotransferase (GGCT)/AIG2-like uncharacterized protein YtfP
MKSHELLADQQFIANVCTEPRYRLYDCGPYPALVEDADGGESIKGELWHVDSAALPRLDAFEGVPTLFQRRAIEIQGVPGATFAYFYVLDFSRLRLCGNEWPPAKT